MTRSLRAAFTLFAVLGLAGSASEARADCPPFARSCADGRVGGSTLVQTTRGAQVVITIGPPPPPVVYVPPPPPPPPVVYVRPAPPPPQVVYVRPAPPPPPQPVYVVQQPVVQPRQATGTTGLHFFVAGAGGARGSSARLGGLGGAFRMRPTEHFAVDFGIGVYGGSDHAGRDRIEVPISVDLLAFVNPQHRVQFYGLAGVGASFAYSRVGATDNFARSYTYVGGELGAGLEFRITRGFALNADLRGVLRTQPRGTPEFVRGTETTRTSAGLLGTLGATLYF